MGEKKKEKGIMGKWENGKRGKGEKIEKGEKKKKGKKKEESVMLQSIHFFINTKFKPKIT